jgi:hypothetical protein
MCIDDWLLRTVEFSMGSDLDECSEKMDASVDADGERQETGLVHGLW